MRLCACPGAFPRVREALSKQRPGLVRVVPLPIQKVHVGVSKNRGGLIYTRFSRDVVVRTPTKTTIKLIKTTMYSTLNDSGDGSLQPESSIERDCYLLGRRCRRQKNERRISEIPLHKSLEDLYSPPDVRPVLSSWDLPVVLRSVKLTYGSFQNQGDLLWTQNNGIPTRTPK